MNRFSIRNLSVLTFMVVATTAQAQELTGSFVGSVKVKKSNTPIADAEVRLTSPNLMGTRVMRTDASGNFRAPMLPPGTYTATVVKNGYVTVKAIADVGLGQVVRQDILLPPVAEVTAVVEVIATAAAVDKTDVKASTLMTSESMDLLPRTTRGLEDMAKLAPGVVSNSATNDRVTIRGSQTTGNRVLLNGTDVADNTYTGGNGRQFFVDDSIAEMQVMQSPVHARYGNFTGGVINAITKSGGNEFSGVFRGNLSRTSWSAQAPRGDRATNIPGNAGQTNGQDVLGRAYSLTFGGPIIKDMIWFQVGTKKQPATTTGGTTANPGSNVLNSDNTPRYIFPDEGAAYTTNTDTKFREIKLTFAPASGHTIEASTSTQDQTTKDSMFSAAALDLASLAPSLNKNEYYSLSYRGLLGNSFTGELKMAEKKTTIQSGGDLTRQFNQRIDARFSNNSTYRFYNATFDNNERKQRNTKTLSANFTWFLDGGSIGNHNIDFGFERLTYFQSEPNRQTPTDVRLFVNGINPDQTFRLYRPDMLPKGVPDATYLQLYRTSDGAASSTQTSYYVNDLWTVTDRWQVMGGLRMDQANAEDTFGSPTVSSKRLSPRAQVTWDINGDQRWLARAHYAVYVGAMHSGFVNKFTYAGNPYAERYASKGNFMNATYGQVTDYTSNSPVWDISASGFLGASGGPTATVDKGIKPPYSAETSVGLKHTYANGSSIGIAYSQREFHDFYNDFNEFGMEYSFAPIFSKGDKMWDVRTYWKTDDRIKRTYKSAELEWNLILNREWSFGGNWTFAILKGNGEGSDSTATSTTVGDSIGDFDSYFAAKNIPLDQSYPYGYLSGDVRHRGNMWLTFQHMTSSRANFYGSLLFNYAGGSAWSLTRSVDRKADMVAIYRAYNTAHPEAPLHASESVYQGYGSWTRFFGDRGFMRDNDTFNFDLRLGFDMPVAKKLRAFTEFTVSNVFNHWQISTHRKTTVSSTATYGDGKDGFYATPLTPGTGANAGTYTGFGTHDYNDFVGGRSFRMSFGFKW